MKNEFIGALVVVALFLGAALYFSKNATPNMNKTNTSPVSVSVGDVGNIVTDPQSEDLVVGTGAEAVAGKKLSMHYVGTLLDGTKFDSSRDRGTPFEFVLGAGMVIKGWDEGIVGMKVGGKRKLTIPSTFAYGAASPSPAIPPNSTLVFEVELLDVK
jgi:FKBP-type peptidyl-prolyl cis-trans isomerase